MSVVSVDVGSALAAAANFESQRNQLAYQKELNNLQMQREDSAYQRAVSDAMAAGLSPLAVSGTSGAAANALNAGTAPQFHSPISVGGQFEINSRRLRMEESAVNSANAKNAADADKASAEAQSVRTANKYQEQQILQQMEQRLAQIENTLSDTSLKGAQREKVLEEKNNVVQQIKESESRVKQIEQDITFKAIDQKLFNSFGLPYTAQLPGHAMGFIPEAYRMTTTMNRHVNDVSNAVKKSIQANKDYQAALSSWKDAEKQARNTARHAATPYAASAYMKNWYTNNPKPNRSDF